MRLMCGNRSRPTGSCCRERARSQGSPSTLPVWTLSSGEDGLTLYHRGSMRAVGRGRVCWGTRRQWLLTVPWTWTSQGDALGNSSSVPKPKGTAALAGSCWPHWLDRKRGVPFGWKGRWVRTWWDGQSSNYATNCSVSLAKLQYFPRSSLSNQIFFFIMPYFAELIDWRLHGLDARYSCTDKIWECVQYTSLMHGSVCVWERDNYRIKERKKGLKEEGRERKKEEGREQRNWKLAQWEKNNQTKVCRELEFLPIILTCTKVSGRGRDHSYRCNSNLSTHRLAQEGTVLLAFRINI